MDESTGTLSDRLSLGLGELDSAAARVHGVVLATNQASHSQVTFERSNGDAGASAVVRVPQSRLILIRIPWTPHANMSRVPNAKALGFGRSFRAFWAVPWRRSRALAARGH